MTTNEQREKASRDALEDLEMRELNEKLGDGLYALNYLKISEAYEVIRQFEAIQKKRGRTK